MLMLSGLRTHLTFANVGVVVALVLAGGGFAVAAIPARDGVIHACLNKRSGALRVIDSARHCTRRERALNWNQQGKPGVAGANGKPGQPGSDAQFSGAAAGGDLTGSYPAPILAPNVVTGAKVAGNSLTGANIDESTLGQVPDASHLGGTPAVSIPTRQRVSTLGTAGSSGGLPIPGVGTFTFACPTSPTTGTRVSFKNQSGSPVDVFIDDSAAVGTVRYTKDLADQGTVSTGIDPATDAVRNVTIRLITAVGHSGATLDVAMIRNSSGTTPCRHVGNIID
jgi:hypothetical protein